MEPFLKSTRCPKCDSDKIDVQYCNGSYCGHSCPSGIYSYENKEHLDRTCGQCGFSWAEKPMGDKIEASALDKDVKNG